MSLLLILLLFGGISGLLVGLVIVVYLVMEGRKTSSGNSNNESKKLVDPDDSKYIEMQPLTKTTSNPQLLKYSLTETDDVNKEKLQNRENHSQVTFNNSEENIAEPFYPIFPQDDRNISEDKKKNDSLQLRLRSLQLSLITQQGDISEIQKYPLTISVFSTASSVGGYCVNIPEKTVEFYSLPVEELPKMSQAGENLTKAYIEGVNKIFALYLWRHIIIKPKKLLFYTRVQHEEDKEITEQISNITNGLKLFDQVEIEEISEDPKINPETYAASVLPAEDLAKGKLRAFEKFVSFYYSISRADFRGTQELPNPDKVEIEHVSEFRKSAMSDGFIERVRKQMTTSATWKKNENISEGAE